MARRKGRKEVKRRDYQIEIRVLLGVLALWNLRIQGGSLLREASLNRESDDYLFQQ